jgi:predicted nucleic acid-binding protein
VLPVQVLAELHAVLVRKAGLSLGEVTTIVESWRETGEIVSIDEQVLEQALALAAMHRLQIYDALVIAAAVTAGADLLVSEDLQDGLAWRGVAVTNPFGPAPDARLADWLR